MSNFAAVLLSIIAYLAVVALGCLLFGLFIAATGVSGGVASVIGLGWVVVIGVVASLVALTTYDKIID